MWRGVVYLFAPLQEAVAQQWITTTGWELTRTARVSYVHSSGLFGICPAALCCCRSLLLWKPPYLQMSCATRLSRYIAAADEAASKRVPDSGLFRTENSASGVRNWLPVLHFMVGRSDHRIRSVTSSSVDTQQVQQDGLSTK